MWPFSAIKKHRDENARLKEQVEVITRSYEDLKDTYKELMQTHTAMLETAKETQERSLEAEEKVKELEQQLEAAETNTNQVRLAVDDDLSTITPFTSVKPEMWETFLEAGMVSDTTVGEGKKFAMQLALMTVAHDGLSQILEQFAPEPKETD